GLWGGSAPPPPGGGGGRPFFPYPPRPPPPRRAGATAVPPLAARTLSASTDSGVGTVQIGWRVPGLRDPDTATRLILADAINNRRGALGRLSVE
ncbi:hypothetical protein, partial [Gluconacetobacter sp.]|uniref:hypothetical protein n=1 Tax=Gluconacetobacter sp. TaxID=1935994 RepID=UPI0039E81DCC